jgi:hypothetical protein
MQALDAMRNLDDDPQWGSWADRFRTRLILGKGAALVSPASPVRPPGRLTRYEREVLPSRIENQLSSLVSAGNS